MEEEGLPDEEVSIVLAVSRAHTHTHTYTQPVLQKRIRRSQHARKETEFLRLKRTRLGLEDFESLKVIGRGAFGEVSIHGAIRILTRLLLCN